MIDSIKYYKFVKELQKLADEQNLNLKITHIVKDGEVIIVFKREFEKFGMRYEKIDHLTHDDILGWVDSKMFVRKELGWLKTAMDSIREEREAREEKEEREKREGYEKPQLFPVK
ncbi:hypothetical protein [Oceanirhabdus seepicola]|uniref:Uncharacterized protein n=1 Tax=Oceanirhabdus seepicola TaxID=2828781 RepID=A0A9J6NWH9_9CLOT|nr:hypothetical protein [Oceanirhabdus seepicola]MCM1988855.1 hypothetical protein [Oceanirhabdus seepicola]